jgi:hypothetical protein
MCPAIASGATASSVTPWRLVNAAAFTRLTVTALAQRLRDMTNTADTTGKY